MAFAPRSYQVEALQAMTVGGKKRGALVWHRRAGKDLTILNLCSTLMRLRSGIYYYFLPTYAQAKKIVWDGIDAQGRPFISNFPRELIAQKHETELKITYKPEAMVAGQPTGSIFQLIGGDNIDSIVGTNPVVCVFSEYSIMNPRAWDLTQPILAENGGIALFAFTPRGRNWGHRLWTAALANPEWFTSFKTVDHTYRDSPGEDGRRVVTPEQIEEARRSGMSEEMIQQEFYCSFEGAMVGAYYADQIAVARMQGRVCSVPYNPAYPVDTAWDFGIDDAMAIWFTQTIAGQCLHIDYMENAGHGLDWYFRELRMRGYGYGRHYAPHDVTVRSLETGNTRLQYAASQGIHFEPQPKLALEDGIQATRMLIPVSVYDAEKCAKGIDALASYRRDFDEKVQTWRTTPVHDWASHGADAERTRAVAWRSNLGDSRPAFANTSYDVHGPTSEEQQRRIAEQFRAKYSRAHGPAMPEPRAAVEIEHGDDWWR